MNQLELFPETVEIHVILLWWVRGNIYLGALGPKAKIRTERSSCTLLQKTFPGLVISPSDLPSPNRVSTRLNLTKKDWAYWVDLGNTVDWIITSGY